MLVGQVGMLEVVFTTLHSLGGDVLGSNSSISAGL